MSDPFTDAGASIRAVSDYAAAALAEDRAVGAIEIAEALSPRFPWLDAALVAEVLGALFEPKESP
jgi:hypothetical protein